jgi:hypothetical protein
MAYRDILHTRTDIFFGDNTFCHNKELTQPPDADNRSATKELPAYVQKVYPQPDKSSLHPYIVFLLRSISILFFYLRLVP